MQALLDLGADLAVKDNDGCDAKTAASTLRRAKFRQAMTDILEKKPKPVYVPKKKREDVIEVFKPLSFRKTTVPS